MDATLIDLTALLDALVNAGWSWNQSTRDRGMWRRARPQIQYLSPTPPSVGLEFASTQVAADRFEIVAQCRAERKGNKSPTRSKIERSIAIGRVSHSH